MTETSPPSSPWPNPHDRPAGFDRPLSPRPLTPPSPPAPPPPQPFAPRTGLLDETGRLCVSALCRQCGYNLRGLAPNGNCPECGLGVAQSLGADLLSFADSAWLATLGRGLRRLRAGTACVLAYPITATVLVSAGALLFGSPAGRGPSAAFHALLLGVALLQLLLLLLGLGLIARAAWLLTAPDTTPQLPPGPNDGRARVAYSLLLGVAALGTGLLASPTDVPAFFSVACAFGGLITLLLGAVALCSVLRELARRVPDEAAAAQATNVRGCTHVLVVVVSIMAVSTLVLAGAPGAPGGDGLMVAVFFCGLIGLLLAAVILVLTLRLSHRLIRRLKEITALRQQGAAAD